MYRQAAGPDHGTGTDLGSADHVKLARAHEMSTVPAPSWRHAILEQSTRSDPDHYRQADNSVFSGSGKLFPVFKLGCLFRSGGHCVWQQFDQI